MSNTKVTAATATAAAAKVTADALADGIAKGNASKGATLRRLFGPDADNTAAALALKVARVMAGESKLPAGGTGTKIGAVRKVVTAAHAAGDAAALTPRGMVTAARIVLDKHAADVKSAKDARAGERAALMVVANDRGAKVGARKDAWSKVATLDAAAAKVKDDAARDTLTRALTAAISKGMTAVTIGAILSEVTGADVSVALPAPVAVEPVAAAV